MVPYNSENQYRFAHYNNEQYVVLRPTSSNNRGGLAQK
jgi:hypothetical protein